MFSPLEPSSSQFVATTSLSWTRLFFSAPISLTRALTVSCSMHSMLAWPCTYDDTALPLLKKVHAEVSAAPRLHAENSQVGGHGLQESA
eukprot:6290574-Amphidinium_carterae.1